MSTRQMPARLGAVDALRGLALLGMVIVHFQYYAEGPPVWADRIQWMIDAVFTERFWALFAFLFGVGFALQIERWGDKPGFVAVYVRRLIVLAAFAVVISALTGYRVLLSYAFWGFALLPMRRWSPRALLIAALLIACARPVVAAVQWQVEQRTIGAAASNERVKQWRGRWRAHDLEQKEIAEHGTFPQLMKLRLRFELGAYLQARSYIPGPDLLMIVLGALAVKRGVLRHPERHRRLLIGVAVLGLSLGIIADHSPVYQWVRPLTGDALRLQSAYFGALAVLFNGMYQGLAYAAALLLWIVHARTFPRICGWLVYAGRMSLTNYIVQVFTVELLFTGMRLTITRPQALLAAILFFAVQVLYGKWWFARYRMGPAEWLWRSLTFASRQPLRLEPAIAAAVV